MQIPFWPPFQGIRNIKFGLERVIKLLERLDNPHHKLPPTIHFAGTNGKGSTLNFLHQLLKSNNFKVHCYTSPHLIEFNERIILANEQITDDFLNVCLKECQEKSEIHPKIPITFFEGITVAAFLAFSKVKADFLLLETGMGGRLDATNVLDKVLTSIITPISLDHTEFLGDSIEQVTPEKAGIIKQDCQVIMGKQDSRSLKILKELAADKNSKTIIFNEDFKIEKHQEYFNYVTKDQTLKIPNPSMIGSHQIDNLAVAVTAFKEITNIEATNYDQSKIWPARLQKMSIPTTNNELYIDGSHNMEGAKTVLEFLKSKKATKRIVIYSTLQDKDHQKFLELIAKEIDELIITIIPGEPKSQDPKIIQATANDLNISSTINIKPKIISLLESGNQQQTVLITGSLYSAGFYLDQILSKSSNNQ